MVKCAQRGARLHIVVSQRELVVEVAAAVHCADSVLAQLRVVGELRDEAPDGVRVTIAFERDRRSRRQGDGDLEQASM